MQTHSVEKSLKKLRKLAAEPQVYGRMYSIISRSTCKAGLEHRRYVTRVNKITQILWSNVIKASRIFSQNRIGESQMCSKGLLDSRKHAGMCSQNFPAMQPKSFYKTIDIPQRSLRGPQTWNEGQAESRRYAINGGRRASGVRQQTPTLRREPDSLGDLGLVRLLCEMGASWSNFCC